MRDGSAGAFDIWRGARCRVHHVGGDSIESTTRLKASFRYARRSMASWLEMHLEPRHPNASDAPPSAMLLQRSAPTLFYLARGAAQKEQKRQEFRPVSKSPYEWHLMEVLNNFFFERDILNGQASHEHEVVGKVMPVAFLFIPALKVSSKETGS